MVKTTVRLIDGFGTMGNEVDTKTKQEIPVQTQSTAFLLTIKETKRGCEWCNF